MFKLRYLTYTDFGLVEKWYEDMAKKGWQIEKIILPFIHKFKRAEPKEVHYKISLAPNEGTFSAFSKEELGDFDQMAGGLGWQLVDRTFNLNIYRLDPGSPDSLYNDGMEEIQVLNKGVKGELLSISLSTLILGILHLLISSGFFSSEIYYSNYPIFMAPASMLLFIFCLLSLGDHIYFRRRNKQARDLGDLKFSRLSFSRPFVFLVFISFVLVLVAIGSTFLIPGEASNGLVVLLSLLPTLFILGTVYFFRKKIKTMNIKKGNKKLILFGLILLMILATNAFNFFLVNHLPGQSQRQEENLGNFSKKMGRRSFLTKSHAYYSSKDQDLEVDKTVAKSQGLAEDLFARIVKNARNHPYRGAYVKDLSKSYPYDKTYSLAKEDDYVILHHDVVLEVNGDLTDDQVQKELGKILGVD
ncbi:hypothetical protein HMPREF1633_15510 [Tissierellia bacterium S5-A11]|nr:hypothetical protein HMPREF1633_15510 [Tissierellia bacterium S5-A11]